MDKTGSGLGSGVVRCSAAEFARAVGVSQRTLKRWDTSGKLVAGRLPSGRMFYTELHYGACGGSPEKFAEAIGRGEERGADG